MLKKYNETSLLLLVVTAALLAVILYIIGASFITEPLKLGEVFVLKSIAHLAKDALFVPLKPIMYALIILSIGSSLAISQGGLGAKFVRVISFFVIFSTIGAIIALIGFMSFQSIQAFADPASVTSGAIVKVKQIPFALKIYGVMTSALMISIYAGIIFGGALKRLNLGLEADQISDLFMDGFRKFLHVTIPLAVFGSVSIALNAAGGLESLVNLLPLIAIYAVVMFLMWGIMLCVASTVLKRSPKAILRAVFPQAIVSFSTSSSIATLAATKTACEALGADGDESTPFYTIGATVNMVGSCMGIMLVCLYAMSTYGIEMSLATNIVVALQSAIYAVSIAGVPSASVILVQEILVSQGVAAEYATYVTGIIITIDTLLLDRLRTTLNTQSDSMSTAMGLELYHRADKAQ